MSPANRISGCVKFVAGTHKQQVKHDDTFDQNNLLTRGQEIAVKVDESQAVFVESKPGQASQRNCNGRRLIPILMTSVVTALGLLPLAIGAGEPGREIEGPMAIVILGGLMTSMALNLLVLPTLALRFARFEPNAHREKASA